MPSFVDWDVPFKTLNDSVSFFDCSASIPILFNELKLATLRSQSQQFPSRCNFPWLVGMQGKLRRATELTNHYKAVSYVNEVCRNFQNSETGCVHIVQIQTRVCGGMMLFKVGSLRCNSSWQKFLFSVMNADCLRARMFV